MSLDILIVGASARAAAFSALRAGLSPCCIDLFADADLRAICPVERIPVGRYAEGLVEWSNRFGPSPWLFTGALENYPGIIQAISEKRSLWGCSPQSIALVRSPESLHKLLIRSGMRSPGIALAGQSCSGKDSWLIKPVAGAAGFGIREAVESQLVPAGFYAQEFIEGRSCSGLFVGHDHGCLFLGATAQLVGVQWLHAAPCHYAGSVGPLDLNEPLVHEFRKLGDLLTDSAGLRGVFGVDCILRGEELWVIEVNPRYTASVEVWEYAQRRSALTLHRQVFEGRDHAELSEMRFLTPRNVVVGKAIYYAPESLTIPEETPWSGPALANPGGFDLPSFADLPQAGDRIAKGHPVLTILEQGSSADECLEKLQSRARQLDQHFGWSQTLLELREASSPHPGRLS